MPRFVLLFHECPPDYERPSHWDFMLEFGPALRTWTLRELPAAWRAAHDTTASLPWKCPPLALGDCVDAEQLADHRLEYLSFEGPLSLERGRVFRVESGDFRVPAAEGNAAGCLQVEVSGGLLRGIVTLVESESDGNRWTMSVQETTTVSPP